jgi:hypothetical protein
MRGSKRAAHEEGGSGIYEGQCAESSGEGEGTSCGNLHLGSPSVAAFLFTCRLHHFHMDEL